MGPPSLPFCPGRQQSRTVSGFENPDFYAEADTWTTRDHINWRHVQCTDQSRPKQISPLNSNHRLEVATDFKREWKDNSCTGQGFVDGHGLFPHFVSILNRAPNR